MGAPRCRPLDASTRNWQALRLTGGLKAGDAGGGGAQGGRHGAGACRLERWWPNCAAAACGRPCCVLVGRRLDGNGAEERGRAGFMAAAGARAVDLQCRSAARCGGAMAQRAAAQHVSRSLPWQHARCMLSSVLAGCPAVTGSGGEQRGHAPAQEPHGGKDGASHAVQQASRVQGRPPLPACMQQQPTLLHHACGAPTPHSAHPGGGRCEGPFQLAAAKLAAQACVVCRVREVGIGDGSEVGRATGHLAV